MDLIRTINIVYSKVTSPNTSCQSSCGGARKPQVRHSTFTCLSWLTNSTDQTFFSCAHLISDHLRNNGDSWGHSPFGGSVCVGSGTTVHSLSTKLSPLTRVWVVAWETWNDFTTSPEKVLIHTSTDREMRSSKKYLARRKHLYTGVQTPMSAWQRGCYSGQFIFNIKTFPVVTF